MVTNSGIVAMNWLFFRPDTLLGLAWLLFQWLAAGVLQTKYVCVAL